jgi:hypothetical protein
MALLVPGGLPGSHALDGLAHLGARMRRAVTPSMASLTQLPGWFLLASCTLPK